MRALVTGATGFVGRHLTSHLEETGDDVVDLGVDELDVTDAPAVRSRMLDVRPTAVYHLAGLSHVGRSWEAPGVVFRVNAEGTLNVLRAATEAGVERVLVVGSGDEYGAVHEADLPIREEAPLRPLTPYAASKVAADYLALQAHLGEGLGTIRVRAFNHTGPGQETSFVVPSIAERIARAEREGEGEIPIGALDAVRDFTDVRDVVRAYRLLVEHGEPGEVYNACSGTGRSVREVVDELVALAEILVEPVIDPALVRPAEVPRLVGDPTRLIEATGWKPEIPFSTTIADVLDEQRARATG